MSVVEHIKLHVLEAITDNFSEEHKIRSGGFADYYKGVYNGKQIVVKKLRPLQGLDDKEFDNEVRILRDIHHENVVRLIGYCYETQKQYVQHDGQLIFATVLERAICYEYIQGGSLDTYISDESCDLDWPTCYKIIKGTCVGLNHLHSAFVKPIFHMDLKPANILLDKNKTAKIGDFSLSLLVDSEEFKCETIQGSHGYMPPEYMDRGITSMKYDVFSFGVIIMKIMAGNKGYYRRYELPTEEFVEIITTNWNWKERLRGTSGHSSQEINMLQVKACVDIALRCIQADRNRRPYIKEIVDELDELESKIKKMSLEDRIRSKMSHVGDIELHMLETITNNFSEERKVGSGGYGDVYKGLYHGKEFAVKKLHHLQGLDNKVFDGVFHELREICHPNVVFLIGYCYESRSKSVQHNGELALAQEIERALCFEYMRGGSLDKHISDESCVLDWTTCFKIIKGICEGLNHLHSAREKPIFHLELKPANILLDENMTAKIGDLGMSRLVASLNADKTEMRNETVGYMPPEYINYGTVSEKFDVFSLGVLILKIMAGNQGYILSCELPFEQFVKLVTNNWNERLHGTPEHSSKEISIVQVEACVDLASRCVHADPKRRPYIKDIVNELEELESKIKKMLLSSDQSQDRIGLLTTELNIQLDILERIVDGSEEPKYLYLSLLQSITEYFNENRRIGAGGCGEVYKGTLRNGVIVAVKRLFKSSTIKDKMFDREVKSLIKVKHQNIVRFLGYCYLTEEHVIESGTGTIKAEIRERLLCLEYIRNGSLDSYLTDELRGLEWHTRYEIIVGICEGLFYLHKKGIIHMDLKPANILLDDLMVPKITDFGLSRLEADYSHTATASRLVSRGYCAPEYLLEGESSSKSDIYCLGVIILELVTGSNKPYKLRIPKVIRKWRHRWIKSSKHTLLGYQQVTKCLELAQICTQYDPTRRPDMSDIIDELKKIDSKDNQFQEIPCLADILGIEPLEIHFPVEEHGQQIPYSLELTNDTDDYFAFITKTVSLSHLRTEPEKGIVQPRSKCNVTVIMQAPVNALPNNHKEEITVLSTRVDGDLADMNITRDMFIDEEAKVVDEVSVTVAFGKPPLAEKS